MSEEDAWSGQPHGFFFSDPERVQALRNEAATWIGTPFRPFSRAKGLGGGCDCLALPEMLYLATGLLKPGEFVFHRAAADYQSHTLQTKVLDYLRGKIWRDPQSARLPQLFEEIKIPEFEGNPPPSLLMPGDLLIFRQSGKGGGIFHTAVLLDPHHFISCVPGIGVCRSPIQDTTFSTRFVALFRPRFRGGDEAQAASTLQPFNPSTSAEGAAA